MKIRNFNLIFMHYWALVCQRPPLLVVGLFAFIGILLPMWQKAFF